MSCRILMIIVKRLFSWFLVLASVFSGSAKADDDSKTQLFEKQVCKQGNSPRKGEDGVILLEHYAIELMSDVADLKFVNQTTEVTNMYISLDEGVGAYISIGDKKYIDMPLVVKDLRGFEVGDVEADCCLSSFGKAIGDRKIIYTFPDLEGEAIMFDQAATRDITNVYLGIGDHERFIKMTFSPQIECEYIGIYHIDEYTKWKKAQKME